MMSKPVYEHEKNQDGSDNKKYIDLLAVDKPIAGQSYGCFSFISPEKVLAQKNIFFMDEFVKQWDLATSLKKFHQFLNYISYKYGLDFNELSSELETFVKTEEDILKKSSVLDDYKTFIENNEDTMTEVFRKKNGFRTTTRGFKARGNFSTKEEAELKANEIVNEDPTFNVHVGPIGVWLPTDPDPHRTKDVKYMNDELNQLMHENKNNTDLENLEFKERVKTNVKQAMDDNVEKATASGNVLTQSLDVSGNLVNVNENSDIYSMFENNAVEHLGENK